VDAIVAQREALAKQMQRVRHSMAQQEGAIRASLELLRRSGASFALPPDVARALDVPGRGGGWQPTLRLLGLPRAPLHLAA
jgi:hypothetical protein